jgi:hypothetical protein
VTAFVGMVLTSADMFSGPSRRSRTRWRRLDPMGFRQWSHPLSLSRIARPKKVKAKKTEMWKNGQASKRSDWTTRTDASVPDEELRQMGTSIRVERTGSTHARSWLSSRLNLAGFGAGNEAPFLRFWKYLSNGAKSNNFHLTPLLRHFLNMW